MIFTLLDVVDEPSGFADKYGRLLAVAAILALLALTGIFLWRRYKKKTAAADKNSQNQS